MPVLPTGAGRPKGPGDGLGLQGRLESTAGGRALISALLVALLLSILAINLPGNSELRRVMIGPAQPFLNALGLDQNWGVFAPDPRRESIALEARVTFSDGTTEVWEPPRGGRLIDAYWDHKWAKYEENAIQDAHRDTLWRPTALFAAREVTRDGKQPTHVTLVRRFQANHAPGKGPDRGPLQEVPYFDLDVRAVREPTP